MNNTYATLITIGDELLIGQVIDTNSAWMAQQLNAIGVIVKRRISVGDNKDDIIGALDDAAKDTKIILITGGLGPTADDITKPLLCDYFGGAMVVDPGALQNVTAIFKRLNRPMIPRNLQQAEVPDVCTVIQNKRGTAPGMWFEKNDCIFVSMPGVPHEMKGMMENDVLKALTARFSLPFIIHKTLLTAGVGESFLADLISEWEQALPATIKLAYLPNYGMVRLRLTAIGENKSTLENNVTAEFERLQELVKDYLVTTKDEPMEAVVAGLLKTRKKTMSTAESCTGGYIAHLVTSMPGSSAIYLGSVVSYDNSVKQHVLGVSADSLQLEGAVSEEVVSQMLKGVLNKTNTDYAVAVSGIMGPDGGSVTKPVGTVWIAAGNTQQIITRQFHFRFDRRRNIELTATTALNMLRQFILADEAELY
ncbi:MAG: CinA family nicotinamide mononucleotide deamidase-related protein [Bacteroidota bacterium]